jgi:eukaryotic-like serine/threonine-protein kinase
VLGQDIIANKSSLSRFLQEARAVNQIKHRNLVDIFSFGELPDGRPYFVMEYLEGKSLASYLEQAGALPFSEILHLFDQACRALQAAHDQQIIHRDLKPDNIYLILEPTQPPFVKILDFGIAKLSTGNQKRLTQTKSIFGTPGYMAPEQYEGAKNVDHRADIYALAVILFEMLTSQTPFALPGENIYVVISRQMSLSPPKASSKISNRLIPPAVDQFLLKALSLDREERPQSCIEFYQQLLVAVGDKRTETRANMIEWLLSPSAITHTSIDLDAETLSSQEPKWKAPKSQLDGLVGEVMDSSQTLKKDKKKLAIGLGVSLSLLLVLLLVATILSQETPKVISVVPPSQPISAPNKTPIPQTDPSPTPTMNKPPPKEPKKEPKKEPSKLKNPFDDESSKSHPKR